MRGQGKNVLKCVPTHQKWPNYQEFLAHLAGYLCTCEYTNVPFWDKMVHLSGMFIYPAVHLCGVHCIMNKSQELTVFPGRQKLTSAKN